MIELIIGIIFGGIVSWFIAAWFHKKQEHSLPPSLLIEVNKNLKEILDADDNLRSKIKTISKLTIVKQNAELTNMITELKNYVSALNKNINKLPKQHEMIYKFFSNSMAAANGLKLTLIEQAKLNDGKFTRIYLFKQTLEWCRAFFEMTVSKDIPKNKDSHFKIDLWVLDKDDNLNSIINSYPTGEVVFNETQKVTKGVNGSCLWKSFNESEVVICSDIKEIETVFPKQNLIKIASVACFPVKDPVLNKMIGVLTVATNIANYFNNHDEEKTFIDQLISPFKLQLALADNFN